MRRCALGMLLLLLLPSAAGPARSAQARSWTLSTDEEFARGTFDGVSLDERGQVRLAPGVETLWGPDEGIVWDVVSDGAAGAFVALSSPGRVLHVTADGAETWITSGDEHLMAAIASDGEGGLYVGLSPGGRVLRARSAELTEEVAATGALFVWALERDPDGALWIGTGMPGMLLRYEPGGEPTQMFHSGDDPVRCISAIDGDIVFGTGGRGRVIRLDRKGRPFVLLDADQAEIVALEPAGDGSVYALAARGSKQVSAANAAAAAAQQTVRVVARAPDADDGEGQGEERQSSQDRRRAAPGRFKTAPGGVVYQIGRDGGARRIWESPGDVPFDLERTVEGKLLIATGDAGRIYSLDPRLGAAVLLEVRSDQATALATGPDGRVLVGGTTDARLGRIGPELRSHASYLTPTVDAGSVADWGRLGWDAEVPRGARLRVHVRGGNTAEPDTTWSEWTALAAGDATETQTRLGPSRWFQARIDLRPAGGGASPVLRRLELFYAPRNRQPAIGEINVLPAGVVWTRSATQSTRPSGPVVASDPVARKTLGTLRAVAAPKPVRKSYELGARTVTWTGSDPDGDTLTYDVEIRHDGDEAWIPLAVDVDNEFYSWDDRGLPDGLYRIRLTVRDSRDNPEGAHLEDRRVSAAFWTDNTRPSVANRRVSRAGTGYEVEFVASDPGGNVAVVEVAVDAGQWQRLAPLDGVADSEEERYQLVVEPGEVNVQRTLRVRVTDSSGNLGGDAWVLEDE